jgi:L-lactate dehydrogenase complex protein LldG
MTDRARFLAAFRQDGLRDRTPLPSDEERDALVREVFAPVDDLPEAFAGASRKLGLETTRLSRGRLAFACRREAETIAPGRFSVEPSLLGSFPELAGLTELPNYYAVEQPVLAELYKLDLSFAEFECAVAETGSLVVRREPNRHRWLTLVPDRMVAVVRCADLVPTLVDLFDRDDLFGDTRGLILATGPSKTADIEMTLVTGVHGPGQVHVLLIEN